MKVAASKNDADAWAKKMLRETPNERWVELFKQRSDAFTELARLIKEKLSLNERNAVVHNLTVFNSIQCEQLAEAMNRYVDEIAWRTRNLFELNLSLKYILKSDKNLQKYISLGIQEELDFIRIALEKNTDTTDPNVLQLQTRISSFETALKEKGISERTRRLTLKNMALEVSMTDEYRKFFGFISRYVHPSGWFILSEPRESFSSAYRGLLIYRGLLYSLDSYKRIDEYSTAEYKRHH